MVKFISKSDLPIYQRSPVLNWVRKNPCLKIHQRSIFSPQRYKEEKHQLLLHSGQQLISATNWRESSQAPNDTANDQVIEVLTQEEVHYDQQVAQKLKTIVREYDDYFKNPMLHQSVSQNFLRTTMAKHVQIRSEGKQHNLPDVSNANLKQKVIFDDRFEIPS